MRLLIVALILANLAFAAWALLIDRPLEPPAARDLSHLHKLLLASEPVLPGPGVPVAVSSAAAGPAGAGTSGSGPVVTAVAGSAPGPLGHCITLGPFSDLSLSAAAAAALQTRGFSPIQRDEPGQDLVSYWVYLDKVPSDAAAATLLDTLRGSGLTDARTMPVSTPEETRRVSVGLFAERAGAERRARAVRALGLHPTLTEQHESQASYWVDITLTRPGQAVSTQGLLPPAAAGTHLEIRDCPAKPPGVTSAGVPPK